MNYVLTAFYLEGKSKQTKNPEQLIWQICFAKTPTEKQERENWG